DNTFNTYMPWEMFAGMTEADLSALYAYLMSLEPKSNKVVRFVPDKN
ncbi:MAG: cytochrome C, partial [Marinilabiliales bacterium]